MQSDGSWVERECEGGVDWREGRVGAVEEGRSERARARTAAPSTLDGRGACGGSWEGCWRRY